MLKMCGIAGLDPPGQEALDVGGEMTAMLQALKAPGPGLDRLRGLWQAAGEGDYIMRLNVAEAGRDAPKAAASMTDKVAVDRLASGGKTPLRRARRG